MSSALKLTKPGHLLAVVPYLLGFHPRDSVVVVCLRDRRVGLVGRLDLPTTGEESRAVRSLLPDVQRESPASVVLVGYETEPGRSTPTLQARTNALAAAEIPVHDRLVVRDGRWRALDCQDPSCCPPGGQTVPAAVDVPAVAAELVGQELAPHRTRSDLVAELEPNAEAPTVAEAITNVQSGEETLPTTGDASSLWRRILQVGDDAKPITVPDAARAAVSLTDVGIRDGLVAWLAPGCPPAEELPEYAQAFVIGLGPSWPQRHPDDGTEREGAADLEANNDTHVIIAQKRLRARLIRLCAMLLDEHAAPALTVLACFTWWRGNGALTRAALDRALRCDPSTGWRGYWSRWSTWPSAPPPGNPSPPRTTTSESRNPRPAAFAVGLCHAHDNPQRPTGSRRPGPTPSRVHRGGQPERKAPP